MIVPNPLERSKVEKIKIPGLAFADDTTWVANSQEDLQRIINRAQEFYKLNDIEINPKKSELIAISQKKVYEKKKILLGAKKTEVPIKEEKETVCFLGVWIRAKNQEKNTRNRVKRDIYGFTSMINYKWISTGQVKYLINKVLIPRLEYRLMITLLKRSICDKLF